MSSLLRLHGTPLSNYYNKVKIALLEQGRAFEEVHAMPADLWPQAGSPTGKIPWLQTPDGHCLHESAAIIEYLEDTRGDAPSLFPVHPVDRARCRELVQYLELYIELPVRDLYGAAFWGATLETGQADRAIQQAEKGLKFLARRASFEPWLCGDTFSQADATAWAHLTTVQRALHFVGAHELMAAALPALPAYLEKLATRPSIARVIDDIRLELRQQSGKS